MPKSQGAICLVIDRLSAAYLGALGNTWIHTPAFDRLAAESTVFDRAMIDSPSVAEAYRSYWTGELAWSAAAREPTNDPALPQWCREQSLPTALITDDEEIASHTLASAFDEIIHVVHPVEQKQAADWHETLLAGFFATTVEFLASHKPPALVWLHTAALGRHWDSPQALRDEYAADDDPTAAAIIEPPSQMLSRDTDPDELLSLRHAYAGEVTVLDHCLNTLVDTIAESDWQQALLMITSCRGYPLGEHGIVGRAGDKLYGELVRVPWLLRVPGGTKYGLRSQALVQPADLDTTLRKWLAPESPTATADSRLWFSGQSLLSVADETGPGRMLAIARATTGEMALATPVWFVRLGAHDVDSLSHQSASDQNTSPKLELYVKPDDYHEANEVSNRCLEVVDEFREFVRVLEVALAEGVAPEITPSDALTQDVETRTAT